MQNTHAELNNDTVVQQTERQTNTEELKEVEELTNELKRLLVRHENTLQEEGIREKVEMLERWMESYRRGLKAANNISETGMDWLASVRDHLKLAAVEIQRLEDEGGNPANKQQAEKTEDLIKAADRLDKVIPDIKHIFSPDKLPEDEHA